MERCRKSSSIFLKKWTFFPLFSLSHFQNNAFPSCLGLGLTDSSAGVFKAETNIKVRMAPVTWILVWFVIEYSRMHSKSFWSTIFYGFPAWDLSPFKNNQPFGNLRMWMHHLWQGLKVPNWNQVRWLKNLDVLLEVGIDGYIYGLFHQLINRFLFFVIIHWSHLWS